MIPTPNRLRQRGASYSFYIVPIIVALLAGLAMGLLYDRSSNSNAEMPELAATVLDKPRPLPDLKLTGHDGKAFTNANLQGQWSLLFFGFTNCPDICPNTLALLNATVKQMGEAPPQVVFVSVDPQRDQPEKLASYVTYFNENFVGVTGEKPALNAITEALSVAWQHVPGDSGDPLDYQVEHSSWLMLIDPQGRLRAYLAPPHAPKSIAHDVQAIRAYFDA